MCVARSLHIERVFFSFILYIWLNSNHFLFRIRLCAVHLYILPDVCAVECCVCSNFNPIFGLEKNDESVRERHDISFLLVYIAPLNSAQGMRRLHTDLDRKTQKSTQFSGLCCCFFSSHICLTRPVDGKCQVAKFMKSNTSTLTHNHKYHPTKSINLVMISHDKQNKNQLLKRTTHFDLNGIM